MSNEFEDAIHGLEDAVEAKDWDTAAWWAVHIQDLITDAEVEAGT